MNILKSLLFLFIFLTIKIGDTVSVLVAFTTYRLTASLKSLKKIFTFPQFASSKKSKEILLFSARTRRRGRPRKKTIRVMPLFSWSKLQRIHKTIYLTFLKIALNFFRFVLAIIVAILRVLWKIIFTLLFLVSFKWIKITSQAVKKRRVRAFAYRPSFLYKFKFFILGSLASCFFVFIPLVIVLFISDLPNPENLSVNFVPKTTKIYDRNDNLLYEIYTNQNRTIVKLSEIPVQLKQATIAVEDKNFRSHPGFDLQGIIRAFLYDLKKQGLQGGSTITQQLIKSALLTPEPSIIRKVREITLAFWAERLYTKDQILELYFNYVPYGGTAWGVQAASDVYFGKKVKDLDLAEAAFLAGLPRAPSVYSPFSSGGNVWKKRQKEVLDAMVKLRYVTQKEADEAYKKELVFKSPNVSISAPHFVMYVKDYLAQKYGLSEVERGGLRIKTTLDLSLQEQIEKIVASQVEQDAYLNIGNGAALITNPNNGDILAMVGSKNYFDRENDGNVNITTALRQPGSTIKIVTYSLALSSGFTEASILDDSPIVIPGSPPYTPVNYDGKYRGKISLRLALANSLNIPAVRLAQKLGADAIVKAGREMGISSWDGIKDYGLSITLGGKEVTMKDMATVFGTVANDGKKVVLDPVLEVRDYYGREIYTKNETATQVIDPGVAFIVSDILADNNARSLAFGTNTPLSIPGYHVSVKTGTTDNKRDNWTIGFTKNYVVVSWVGNNNNSPMSPYLTSGITGAAPMWNKIMTMLLKDRQNTSVAIPDNLVKKTCFGRDMYFVRGTESAADCRLYALPAPTKKPE